jgi:hypothetical protein
MKKRWVVLLTALTFIAGFAGGAFAFSVFWRDYNSSVIEQSHSNLESFANALSICEGNTHQCSDKLVAILRSGYIQSLVSVTGIYVISRDEIFQSTACNAIKKVKSASPDVTSVQADAKKHLLCDSDI